MRHIFIPVMLSFFYCLLRLQEKPLPVTSTANGGQSVAIRRPARISVPLNGEPVASGAAATIPDR